MLKPAGILAALSLLTSHISPLRAQELGELCRAAGRMTPGQWASYSVTGGRANGSTMRFAIVGTQRAGDTTLYWFEINTTTPNQEGKGGAIMQMLVPGLGPEAAHIHGLVMKAGGQPAMKMPDQMIGMMSSQMSQNAALETTRRCANAQVVGWETVTVPAGSIRALHVKDAAGGEAWVSRDIPFGIVKVHGKDGGEMALTGRGTDAKSSITEQPQEMPGMGRRP